MVRWLQHDGGLDVVAARILLGQCVEYEVGNVFDPAYTMFSKVPKRVLAQLATSAIIRNFNSSTSP